MNATFHSMSDLVADAEDLLQKLARSHSPEIRALTERVQGSIDDMRVSLRRRVKRRANRGVGRSLLWGTVGGVALISILVAVRQARR